ncbi:MAG: alkaline phosphatase [Bacteroidota bacterium]
MKKKIILSVSLVALMAMVLVSFTQKKAGRPKKVIFLIGDGMGLTQISGAMSEYKGQNAFERFKVIGLSKTRSADDYVTDSGAGATVFSIGKKTFNGAIGVGADTVAYENLFEKLKKKNWSTGVVATSSVTHATPAAFYAHVGSRNSEDDIASFLLKGNCDVAIGGGLQFFKARADKKDLFAELNKQGFVTIGDTINTFKPQTATRLVYTLATDGMKTMQEGRGSFLKQAAINAADILGQNKKGYMLMVEGSQIDWGGHAMDYEYMKAELYDFNETINAVLDKAEKEGDILVVVTADHETGGLTLTANKQNRQSFVPKYAYNKHTGVMVPVFAYGPGAEEFAGIYENTEIFYKFAKLMGLK